MAKLVSHVSWGIRSLLGPGKNSNRLRALESVAAHKAEKAMLWSYHYQHEDFYFYYFLISW